MKTVYALVAVLATGWVIGFVVSIGGPSDPPPPLSDYLWPATIVGLPWLVAVRLLRFRSTMDAPARLLAAAVATLPEDRREWGAAMTAELAQVPGRPARWSFAAGCAWAAAFPPRTNRWLVAAVGALATAATIIAGLAVGGALPALRLFAVAFVGLVGALVLLAVARSRRVRPAAPVTAAVGLLGVAACIAVTGYFLVEFPIGALHLPPSSAVSLAAVLAGFLWLAVAPPRALTTDRLPRGIAVGAAVALGAGLLLVSRLGLRDLPWFDTGIFSYLYLVPVGVIFVGSAMAAAIGRSLRAGVQAAVWTALLTSLAFFAVAVFEAVQWYRSKTSLILAADGVPLHAVGENLRNFAWALVLLPLWWLPFGVMGAAMGASYRRLRSAHSSSRAGMASCTKR